MSNVLLCASASVAIYKACDLASTLNQAGHRVRTLLTPNAAQLIAPQLFEAVTGEAAASVEFGPERSGAMDHIENGRWAELVIVAPGTADLLGRMAAGIADDLLTTSLLALEPEIPRILCPAMNPKMLAHPAVLRNITTLGEDGWEILEPGEGHMACGDEGSGRMVEPDQIARRVEELLGR